MAAQISSVFPLSSCTFKLVVLLIIISIILSRSALHKIFGKKSKDFQHATISERLPKEHAIRKALHSVSFWKFKFG